MFTLKTISTRPLIRTKAQKNDEFIQRLMHLVKGNDAFHRWMNQKRKLS